MNNLTIKKKKIPNIEIVIYSNSINIYFDFSNINLKDLYLTIKSYITNHRCLVKHIYLVENEKINKYVNVSVIIKFNYIEFKMWWFNIENKIGYLSNSKIYNFYDKKNFFIRIETVNVVPQEYPIYPWTLSFYNNL